jgi:hypothetical protein
MIIAVEELSKHFESPELLSEKKKSISELFASMDNNIRSETVLNGIKPVESLISCVKSSVVLVNLQSCAGQHSGKRKKAAAINFMSGLFPLKIDIVIIYSCLTMLKLI